MQSAEGRAEARAPNRQGLDRASPAALALLALALAALLAGCGGGGDGDDEAPPPWSGVTITAPTESDAYATEATALMLGGISFVPATFSCSLIGGSLPEGYLVSWRNAANGATGGGRASIACLPFVGVSWHTFYVPLAMGSNAITVTVTSAVDDRSGSDTLTVTRVPDTTPPTVSSIAPAADAASVSTTAVVVIGFSEPVDAASLDAGHLSLRDTATSTLVPVMVSTSVDGQWASMTPLSPLNASTAYEVRVQNVADLAGNVMATSFTSHFTTASVVTDATPPSVVAIDPAQGALGVPVTAAIEVQFSEPIDFEGLDFVFRVSDAATGDAIAGSVSALSPVPVTVTFRPVSPLVPGTAYKVQVLASDPAGNPMPAPFISQFTTAP